jgi:presenilin-like A22 family membrane protease
MFSIRLKFWDRILGILLTIFSAAAFYYTGTFDYPKGGGAMVDIALFPRFLLIILFGLGVLLTFQKRTDPEETTTVSKVKKLLLLYLGIVIFTLALPRFGFILSSILWIGYICLLVGERKWWIILLASVLGPVLGYYIFQVKLGIPLPEGSIIDIAIPM